MHRNESQIDWKIKHREETRALSARRLFIDTLSHTVKADKLPLLRLT